MSQQLKIMMMEETDNNEIIRLRQDINELLMTTTGLLNDKDKKEKNELLIAKIEELEKVYNNEEWESNVGTW